MKHFTSSVLLSTTTAISSLLFLSLLQNQNVQAADNLARDKCRELHHAEADASSAYSNNNCLLHCVIPKGGAAPAPTSAAADHFMNEGFPCPLAEAGVCRGGQCVPRRAVLPGLKLGSLEIELLAATFPAAANLKTPYINVCLMNSTNHQPLPLQNTATCNAHCRANFVSSGGPGGHSKWATAPNSTDRCAGLFVEHAGVFLEAKGLMGGGSGQAANGGEVFLGGISLTVPQLLSHGDNNRPLHLELTGAKASPQLPASVFLDTRITWTARRS